MSAQVGHTVLPADAFGSWRQQAACRKAPAGTMFPDPKDGPKVAAALMYCRACPVEAECRAATSWERHGVTGGQSELERNRLRKQRRKANQ